MGRPVTKKRFIHWTQKFFDTMEIAKEPAMNKQGFWKKPDYPHVTDKETRRK